MLSCAEGNKAAAELQCKFNPRRSALEKRQAGIQAMQDQFKEGGSTMSDDGETATFFDVLPNGASRRDVSIPSRKKITRIGT